MLSFLREQNSNDLAENTPPENNEQDPTFAKDDSAQTAVGSENTGQTQQQDYLTVKSRDSQVFKGTILLAILFGTGLVCLFVMIKKSSPQSASAGTQEQVNTEEAQIEAAIARFTNVNVKSEMFGQTDQMVKKLYDFSEFQQVGVSELVKNPFRTEQFWSNQNDDIETSPRKYSNGTENMQLLSIMQLNNADCCMIDDKILYEGDSIQGFTICQIENNWVKLRKADTEVVLRLSK
jgi:hypothetical protein